jgi:hypothetical protein
MKFSIALALLNFCLSINALNAAQVPKDGAQDYSKFLIDTTKPYVYLEVDHIGPRKPLRNDEPKTGIWLHLRNNCKLPIAVLAIGERQAGPKEGIALQDEIVPQPIAPATRGDGASGGIIVPSGSAELLDLFRWPNMTEQEVRRAEERQRATSKPVGRPLGYGTHNGFNSFVLTLIAPGDQVYFSVPANHVSKSWHFEIPFRLAVPNNSRIRPPYSYVAFYQDDLDRKAGKPTTPASTSR